MKRVTLFSIVASIGVLALSACGGNSNGSQDSATDQPAPAEEAAAAVEEPAGPAADVAFADLTGNADAGKQVFAVCTTCHVVEEGMNRVGPSLYNIVGREAGSVEGFNYTDANKNSGLVWTPEQLFTYLEDPQAAIPGTRMAFPGVKDPQDRADLIAYVESVSATE